MLVTAVMTAHHEGKLARASIASFREALTVAAAQGVDLDPVIVLDRPDEATQAEYSNAPSWGARLFVTDFGDPGQSRNFGAGQGTGEFVTYLDSDDLWSFNWITESLKFIAPDEKLIGHSSANLIFGEGHWLWVHTDQASEGFDVDYQRIANHWDGLCFTRRSTLLEVPFRLNDLPRGYGHEDWDWNNLTMLAGYVHRPVPGTMHMKRQRVSSQSRQCADFDVVPWPTRLALYQASGY